MCALQSGVSALLGFPLGEVLGQSAPSARCADCRVEFVTLGVLEDDGAQINLGTNPASKVIDPNRVAIWGRSIEGFLLWRPEAKRVQRVARRGNGPGEYQHISNIEPISNSAGLLVADLTHRRVTELDGALKTRRSFPLQASAYSTASAPVGVGMFVVSGSYATPQSVGLPFHVFNSEGKLLRSFGAPPAAFTPKDAIRLARRIASSTDGSFWATRPNEYKLEQWTLDGSLRRTVALKDDDITEPTKAAWPIGGDRPPAEILGIGLLGTDTAMVLIRVPDARWKTPAARVVQNFEGKSALRTIPITEMDKYFDTRVDIIDLKRGAVIASMRRDELFGNFAGARYLQRTRYKPDGELSLEIARVEVTKGRKEP